MDKILTNRRTLLAAAAVAGVATVAGFPYSADAASDPTKTEKENAKIVADFLKLWGEPAPDAEKLGTFMTDDCVISFVPGRPATVGRPAAVALYKTLFKMATRYECHILQSISRGPVVVTSRVDTPFVGDKPSEVAPVVAVFLMKGGKIKEWDEYPYKEQERG